MKRNLITLDSPVVDASIHITSLVIQEAINHSYVYRLCLGVPQALPVTTFAIKQAIQFSVEDSVANQRVYHGYVASINSQQEFMNPEKQLELTVVPYLYFLKWSHQTRYFTNTTLLTVLKTIFSKYAHINYDFSLLSQAYNLEQDFIQHQQSDYDFVIDLMQRAGISFNFIHGQQQTTLYLWDQFSPHNHESQIIDYQPHAAQGTPHIAQYQMIFQQMAMSKHPVSFSGRGIGKQIPTKHVPLQNSHSRYCYPDSLMPKPQTLVKSREFNALASLIVEGYYPDLKVGMKITFQGKTYTLQSITAQYKNTGAKFLEITPNRYAYSQRLVLVPLIEPCTTRDTIRAKSLPEKVKGVLPTLIKDVDAETVKVCLPWFAMGDPLGIHQSLQASLSKQSGQHWLASIGECTHLLCLDGHPQQALLFKSQYHLQQSYNFRLPTNSGWQVKRQFQAGLQWDDAADINDTSQTSGKQGLRLNIPGAWQLKAEGSYQLHCGGHYHQQIVRGDYLTQVEGKVDITALECLTFAVGSSFIRLDVTGIELCADDIFLESA